MSDAIPSRAANDRCPICLAAGRYFMIDLGLDACDHTPPQKAKDDDPDETEGVWVHLKKASRPDREVYACPTCGWRLIVEPRRRYLHDGLATQPICDGHSKDTP